MDSHLYTIMTFILKWMSLKRRRRFLLNPLCSLTEDKVRLALSLSLNLCLTESHVGYPQQFSSFSLVSLFRSHLLGTVCVFCSCQHTTQHRAVLSRPALLPACLAHVSPVSRGNSLRLGVGGFMDGKHEERPFVTQFFFLFGRDWGVWEKLYRDNGDACFHNFSLSGTTWHHLLDSIQSFVFVHLVFPAVILYFILQPD